MIFFRKIIEMEGKEKEKGNIIVGLEASIYVLSSALESMVRPYDTKHVT